MSLRSLALRALLAVWLVVLTLGVLLSVNPAHAEDLLQVYAQARAADPLLAAADAQRGVQREVATQAGAALLPQWQLSGNENRSQQDGSHYRVLTSSIQQVLFDLGRLRSWQAERTLESAQDARVRAAEQDLCARVARAYFGVLSAQAALATAQANEDALAGQAQQALKRFEAGLSAQTDVEQGRAYWQLSRGGTVQARQALADAREALRQITGRESGTLQPLARVLPALPPQPQETQAWVDAALRDNPTLQALVLGVDASEQRVQAARAAHGPTVRAELTTQRPGGAGIAEPGRTQGYAAVSFNIPLFAGGATQSAVRQAGYQRDIARENLQAAQRSVARETAAQLQAVLSAVALLDSTQAAVSAAERALASTRAGMNLGTRSMTDLLLAIQTQTSAQSAHDQARHAYVLSKLLLQQAAGALGQAELAAVNQLLQPAQPPEQR